jgi:uroporphyrin-III C-methyltransferase
MSVFLVGAGPGSADLLTVRAARIISTADAVVYDRLISDEVLALAPETAERIDVGKRPGDSHNQALINDLLVSLGQRYNRVVRIKGGDPFVFGRGGEERDALEAAGISVETVPGVTSAFAAPLAAGIPVTHRGVARGVCVITGHTMSDDAVDYAALANDQITLVVLMGVSNRASIASQLIHGGLSASTPVAAIESASTPQQRIVRCQLDDLGDTAISNPAVLVIGAVAARGHDNASLLHHSNLPCFP